MSSLLELFFEDSSSDDDFEMILALFAATMSNKRPKHGGSLRRRALVCRKKATSSRVSSRRDQIGFAKECVAEMPRTLLDCRPCKRPQLGWDVCPAEIHQMALSNDDLDQWQEQEESDDDDYYVEAVLLADVERVRSKKKHCGSVPDRQVVARNMFGSDRPLWSRSCECHQCCGVGILFECILSLVNQEQPHDDSPSLREDDKYGRYVFAIGDNLTSRYRINAKMGEGTFGQVLECWDRERKDMVAIKITRGNKTYRKAAMIEIGMLKHLGNYDESRSSCIQIRNWFDYCNHICIVFEKLGPSFICIVFEKLGPSLCDFLRKNNYRSFPVALVREVTKQLLECVAFMHQLRLIHTDLKPENILLVSPECIKVPDYKASSRSSKEGSYYKWLPKSNAIKVIDFGSTTYNRQNQSYLVSTRHYRTPEVILGLEGSYPCDIWSVGCILAELCTGEALFQTDENLEHLAMMKRVFGPLPNHMLKMAARHSETYIREGRLNAALRGGA